MILFEILHSLKHVQSFVVQLTPKVMMSPYFLLVEV